MQIPKISEILNNFTGIEDTFENMVSGAGIPIPPGFMKVASEIASQIEQNAPSLPEFGSLPKLPNIPFNIPNPFGKEPSEQSAKSVGEVERIETEQKTPVETVPKSKFDVEVVEA